MRIKQAIWELSSDIFTVRETRQYESTDEKLHFFSFFPIGFNMAGQEEP